jgi:hypothetical protein
MAIGIGLTLLGILALVYWYITQKRGKASLKWPAARGRIMDSRIVESRDTESGTTISASISYAYIVGQTTYNSSRIGVGMQRTGANFSSMMVQKYPAGAEAPVYYDPQKPSLAVLEPGGKGTTFVLIVAIILMVVGIGVASVGTALSGDSKAVYTQATELYNRQDYPAAKTLFEDLAQKGNPEARVYLGVMYAKGQGVPQNFVEAQKWFILAGDLGKNNRDQIQKGLTSAQEQQAEEAARAFGR